MLGIDLDGGMLRSRLSLAVIVFMAEAFHAIATALGTLVGLALVEQREARPRALQQGA